MTIEEMKLELDVEAKARTLQKSAPGVVFLSGRRTLLQQAGAMAANCAMNRQYIAQTYMPSVASRRCQEWVDHHPEAKGKGEIAAGLFSVLQSLTGAQQIQISRHLSGRAFDLHPGSCTVAQVLVLKPQLFLTHEGGLSRWHVSF